VSCILLCCRGIQESLKVELSLAEARVESSRRKIEAEMQMHLEQQVSAWNFCGILQCFLILVNYVVVIFKPAAPAFSMLWIAYMHRLVCKLYSAMDVCCLHSECRTRFQKKVLLYCGVI